MNFFYILGLPHKTHFSHRNLILKLFGSNSFLETDDSGGRFSGIVRTFDQSLTADSLMIILKNADTEYEWIIHVSDVTETIRKLDNDYRHQGR